MKTTIKDIAKILGVSHTTVSRALKDSPDISEAMKEKVRDLARELNYQTNNLARGLVLNKSYSIGVIIPDIENPYYSSICKHLSFLLEKAEYRILICNSGRLRNVERQYLDYLRRQRVDGYVIVPADAQDETFRKFLGQGMPTVLIDYHGEKLGIDSVMEDNYFGATLAVKHLANLGYKTIVHFAGAENATPSEERLQGYLDVLKKARLPRNKKLILRTDSTFESGIEAAQRLYSSGKLPEAIFTVNDIVAMGALQFFHNKKIRIPEDVALVGFDDIYLAKMLPVPLTTVRQSTDKIAESIAEILLEKLNGGNNVSSVKNILLEPELVIRASCGSLYRNLSHVT